MRIPRIMAIVAIAVLIPAVALSGCAGGKDKTTLRVGFITPLTGDVKTFGESTKNGFLLAMEQAGITAEKGGKIGNVPVKLFIQDDRNDVTEGVNVATKLINENKVQAIIGSVTSKVTIPITKVTNDAKVVQLTSTATSPKVTVEDGKRKPYAFRACFIDPFQGTVGAKFALNNLKAKTAAILYDQSNDYTIGLSQYFKEAFEKGGGKVVQMSAYATADVDFSAVLTQIAKLKPDILYLPDYYQKVSLIGKQARVKGIKATFLGGDGWDSGELDFKVMDGGYFTNHYSPDDPRPIVQDFIKAYKAKYGSVPDALATLAYDATNMLISAVKQVQSNDPEKIREALGTMTFNAVSGDIKNDANGNPIKAAAILQIKDGKQKYVATVSP